MFSKRLSVPVQVDFLKQLKFLLSLDGMVLNKALTKIADSDAGSLSAEAEHIIDEIENGSSIFDALSHFDDRVRSVISANNALNNTKQGVDISVEFLEKESKGSSGIIFALAMPTLLCIAEFGILCLIGHVILPQIESVVPRARWPVLSLFVANLGDLIYSYWYLPIGVMFLIPVLFSYAKNKWVGKGRDWCDKYFPGFGLYRYSNAAQLLTILSYMMSNNGFVLAKALSIVGENSSIYMKYHIDKMLENLGGGDSNDGKNDVASSLDTGLLSEKDLSNIRIADEGKNIGYAIKMVADVKKDEFESKILKLQLIAQFTMATITSLLGLLITFSIAPLALNMQGAFH